jgi:pyruvate kinase
MARYVAKYRPEVQILACVDDFVVFKLLSCIRGVIPFQCKEGDFDMSTLIEKAKELELIKGPCKVITLLEADQNNYDKTNEMKIVDVE